VAASIVCGPHSGVGGDFNSSSGNNQADGLSQFHMTTRMNQQMKGKAGREHAMQAAKKTPVQVTPKAATQKVMPPTQMLNEMEGSQSSRASYVYY
jgi:hypothetical protein